MPRFVETEAWHTAVERPNEVRTPMDLTRSDVDELVTLLVRGGGKESVAAFMVLRSVDIDPDRYATAQWDDNVRKRFRSELDRQARQFYTGGRPWTEPCTTFLRGLWARVCPDECVSFLLTLAVSSLDTPIQQDAVSRLAGAARGRTDARARLDELVSSGGELAALATEELERAGIVSPERLAHFGRLWRETHDAAALDWLYYRWVSYLPLGYSKAEILSVLGPPTDGEFPDVYWGGEGAGHFYLELYDHGLAGCHHG